MTGYYHKHCGVITHLLADVAYTTLVLSKFEIQKCLHTYMLNKNALGVKKCEAKKKQHFE